MGNKIETLTSSTRDRNGDQYWASFESKHFSEGTSRLAFKGTLRGSGPRDLDPCVVKVFKKTYAKKFDEWVPDLAASTTAQKWSERWNKEVIPVLNLEDRRTMEFIIPLIAKVDDATLTRCFSSKNERIKPQEYLAIEDYIAGVYEKFTSNGGFEDASLSALMPAFSHWTWEKSGKRLMVCDIQGVRQNTRTGYHYYLTDPAIHSVDQLYGMTDLGVAGMETVLAGHNCNFICRGLDLTNPVPDRDRSNFPKKKASTYVFELKASEIRRNQEKRGKYFVPMSTLHE